MSTKPIILLPNSARCFSLGAAIITFFIFSFTALPTAEAQSNRFEAGVAAKERGQYLTAIRSWLPLAEDGMADAQVNLGHMYNEGFGVDRDLSTALYWYERAAESGLGEAKYNLGLLYFYGDGVPKDLVTAITLFREAEEQNIQEASYMLGVAALSGDGVPIDKTEARERFERAALAGIPEAQLAYASVAQSGEGGEPVSSGFFGLFGSKEGPIGPLQCDKTFNKTLHCLKLSKLSVHQEQHVAS